MSTVIPVYIKKEEKKKERRNLHIFIRYSMHIPHAESVNFENIIFFFFFYEWEHRTAIHCPF